MQNRHQQLQEEHKADQLLAVTLTSDWISMDIHLHGFPAFKIHLVTFSILQTAPTYTVQTKFLAVLSAAAVPQDLLGKVISIHH